MNPDLGRPDHARARAPEARDQLSRAQLEELASQRIEYESAEAVRMAAQAGCTCEFPEIYLVRHPGPKEVWSPVVQYCDVCPLSDDPVEPDYFNTEHDQA